ncbi:unnamed protein product [Allacma fusca]|uniref:C2H2-type domain-containing protein n=1 Tax=Allacma fusca TaxID=39272 RepID=A0A8J2IZX9_9HEXA|nr:unnamed protein product [Allacma fusca]
MVQMNGKNTRNKPAPASQKSILKDKDSSEENKGVWGCNICDSKFTDSYKLSSHSLLVHAESHPAECRLCFGRFVNDSELGIHIKIKHIQGLSGFTAVEPVDTTINPKPIPTESLKLSWRRRKTSKKAKRQESVGKLSPSSNSVGKPPRPKKRKEEPKVRCRICDIDFENYDDWRQHAVYQHIFTKNPYPIVEMNYVVTLVESLTEDCPNDSNSNETFESSKEKLTLTICKNKGRNYIVKKSSISDESEYADDTSELSMTVDALPDELKSSDDQTNPQVEPVSAETSGSILERRLKRPLKKTTSNGQNFDSTSECGDKENMPSETEIDIRGSDREQQLPLESLKALDRYSSITIEPSTKKLPGSGSVVYLASTASESERALANSGDSKMVIIQNDILRIGDDAAAEDLQRLAASSCQFTSSTNVLTVSSKSVASMPRLYQPPLGRTTDGNHYSSNSSISDSETAECILPNLVDDDEEPPAPSAMISDQLSTLTKDMVEFESTPGVGENPKASTLEMGEAVVSGDDKRDKESALIFHPPSAQGAAQTPPLPAAPSPRVNGENNHPRSDDSTGSATVTQSKSISQSSTNNNATTMDNSDSDSGLHIHIPEENAFEDVSDDEAEKSTPVALEEGSRNEEIITGDPSENDMDDFRCRVCGKNFASDDEVENHFSAEHFRVGTSSNILEPESPAPAQIHQNLYLQEREEQNKREEALAMLLRRENATATNTTTLVRPAPVHAHPHPSIGPLMHVVPPRNIIPTSASPLSNTLRPPLSSAPSNYEINQHMSARMSFSAAPSGRPPLTMGPLSVPRQAACTQSQPQITHYPTSLHMALTNPNNHRSQQQVPVPQQQASPMIRNAHEDGPRIVDVTSMHRPQQIRAIPNPHHPQVHHHPYGQPKDGIIANMTAAHQPTRQMQPPTLQRAHVQSSHHPQPDSTLRLSHSTMPNQVQTHLRQANSVAPPQLILGKRTSTEISENMAKHPRHDNNRTETLQQVQAQAYNGLQITHGQFNNNSRIRQAPSAHSNPSQSISPASISPDMHFAPSPPNTPTLDKNVAAAIGTGMSSVRLGNAITLSVCPSSEAQITATQRSTGVGVNCRGPQKHHYINTSTVTNALAVRGVTVTPASPPVGGHEQQIRHAEGSNSPIVPTSPCSSPTAGGPYSVIQRVERTPNSISPIRNFSPPVSNPGNQVPHQFAIPRNPAPRSITNGIGHATATANIERPDRPPTVDLTDDDVLHHHQAMENSRHNLHLHHQHSMHHAAASEAAARHARSQLANNGSPQNQYRPPQRNMFPCHQCNSLFSSSQVLEEHKMTVHGYGQRGSTQVRMTLQNSRPTADQLRQAQSRHQTPQMQANLRPQSPSSSRSSADRASKNLCIPLLDLSRLDPVKLKHLEDIGISCIVPLTGNERNGGIMGIPVMSLRQDGLMSPFPWDSVLPLGPVYSSSHYAASAAAAAHAGTNPNVTNHGNRMPSPHQ